MGIAETIAVMVVLVPSFERAIENITKTTVISAKIGEAVKVNGISLTVKDVKTTKWLVLDYLGGKKAFPSKDGYKFVMLFVIVNNTGPKTESMFNIWNESITTNKGYLYERISISDVEMSRYDKSREPTETELKEYYCLPLQTWKEISPGEWTGGCYFFEIKEDHEPAIFSFNTGAIGGKIFNIHLKS